MFAVVDANNFFASCERVFRPDLTHKPVAVLSSNDGCIVARSKEVKDLGIPMGAPYFKVEDQLKRAGVNIFSSNFGLYSDLSQRMQSIIASSAPEVEVYSIDEAFVSLGHLQSDELLQWGRTLRHQIWQWLGLPVAIGIAPTKTLAKIASHAAKQTSGGVILLRGANSRKVLEETKLDDIWGVGRRLTPKLEKIGLKTAADLAQMDLGHARKIMGKKGVQTVMELGGQMCYPMETIAQPPKSIMVSRSFGHRVSREYQLETAAASFIAKASAKLRHHHLRAGAVSLSLRGVRGDDPYYLNIYRPLTMPTSDTSVLIAIALELLASSFNPEISYKKAGILLFDLKPDSPRQTDMFLPETSLSDRRRTLMSALDQVNKRYGEGALQLAAEGMSKHGWKPRSELRSPNYTRSWQELPLVF